MGNYYSFDRGNAKINKRLLLVVSLVPIILLFQIFYANRNDVEMNLVFGLLSLFVVYPTYKLIVEFRKDKHGFFYLIQVLLIDFIVSLLITYFIAPLLEGDLSNVLVFYHFMYKISGNNTDLIFVVVVIVSLLLLLTSILLEKAFYDNNDSIKDFIELMSKDFFVYLGLKVFFFFIIIMPVVTVGDISFSLLDLSNRVNASYWRYIPLASLYFYLLTSAAVVVAFKKKSNYGKILFDYIYSITILVLVYQIGYHDGTPTIFAPIILGVFTIIHTIINQRDENFISRRENNIFHFTLLTLTFTYYFIHFFLF